MTDHPEPSPRSRRLRAQVALRPHARAGGQPFNPPVEDGLALMADMFLGAGFTEADVHAMAVTNTMALAERHSKAA